MKYCYEDGLSVVYFLEKNGFPGGQIIGSLARAKGSDHDIDIFLPNNSLSDKERLVYLFLSSGVTETDWGGLYFDNTKFGDIDIFFSIDEFDY